MLRDVDTSIRMLMWGAMHCHSWEHVLFILPVRLEFAKYGTETDYRVLFRFIFAKGLHVYIPWQIQESYILMSTGIPVDLFDSIPF